MSAYILFDNLTVTSPEDLETYKSQVAEVVEKHQGKTWYWVEKQEW
ncbi:hypothetical protein [Ekhidna sp.]